MFIEEKEISYYPLEIADSFQSGFEIDDEWVVGRGMDNEKGYARNYQNIFVV